MRKLLAVLCLLPGLAYADGTQMLKSTTPSNTGPATIVCGGTDTNSYGSYAAVVASLPYSISNADTIIVSVYSAAGATATTTISTAPTASGPWYVVATVTDPSATGEQWSIPRTNYVKFSVTAYTNGTIKACIGAWRDSTKIY